MARAGAARWRGRGAGTTEGDEVQRSLELLDRVLSEFDDLENASSGGPAVGGGGGGGGGGAGPETARAVPSGVSAAPGGGDSGGGGGGDSAPPSPSAASAPPGVGAPLGGGGGGDAPGHASSSTPDDESPSLGHQSEDDGYMSMNGRRAKFVLSFRPVPDEGGGGGGEPPAPEPPPPPAGEQPADAPAGDMADFPPPPEEAERIISTLLPRVSPGNSTKRSQQQQQQQHQQQQSRRGRAFLSALASLRVDAPAPAPGAPAAAGRRVTTAATQTTLPKTRHQRPFGWETGAGCAPAAPPPARELRFGSLPTPAPSPAAAAAAAADDASQARVPPPWLPPRTVPGVLQRHRGVRRHPSQEDGVADLPPPPPLVDYERGRGDEEDEDDRANFSEDSLEELPMPATKRSSIAWEVPLDDDPLLTPGSTKVVGRRRRRSGDHSSTGSIHRLRDADDWPEPPVSTEDEAPSPFSDSYYDSSATNDLDDFVPPKLPPQHAPNGTYIIRKGRKKERKPVPEILSPQEIIPPKFGDLKRCSSTFDNIKSLIKEGLLEGLDDAPPDFKPPTPPGLVRVVSLPTLPSNDNSFNHHENVHYRAKAESHRLQRPHELAVTMEEEEDLQFCSNLDNLSDELGHGDFSSNDEENKLIEQLEREHFQNLQNKANENRPRENGSLSRNDSPLSNRNSFEKGGSLEVKNGKDVSHKRSKQRSHHRDKLSNGPIFRNHEHSNHSFHHNHATEVETNDPWTTVAELNHVQAVPVVEEESARTHLSALPADFKVTVEVLQHEFPPLPPSPVEEDEEEYSEIVHPSPVQTPQSKSDTLPEPFYRSPEPCSDPIGTRFLNRPCPPEPPPHQEQMSSLKTRSMDAGFSRGHRSHSSNKREIPSERRTLPPELPGPPRRRTFQKRSAHSPREEGMQTSCSLPETPIFARGCDIPRTPHRRAPDVPSGVARTTPRPSGLVSTAYRRPGAGHGTTAGLGSGGLGQALVGAELLRLAGGPGRGWYPRHRQQPRPASVERLDRLAPGHSPGHSLPSPWDTRDSRKPLTLPPNLSPKFFHRSPREALRRVTSLLIRKGSSSKESKKDALSPTGNGSGVGGEASGEACGRQKRGFFKSFWKRSRHYSLEQPPPAPPQ